MTPTAAEVFGVPEVDYVDIEREVLRERARREAKRLVDAEERGRAAIPPILTLRERLARPRAVRPMRIEGFQMQGGRVMLAAQFKSGKTTTRDNAVKALVDGGLFLGQFAVTPIRGSIAIIDTEMSEDMLDDWLAQQGIRNDDRVLPIPLRGRASAFDILDSSVRAEWARLLREHRVVYPILDCLRPVLDSLGLDEHRDAGRFLVAFDALLAEAGIAEAMVIHHMGHNGERARGDSRLRDWPDVEWRLVRQDENPASPRFITAYGRDVDTPESQLQFDKATRTLSVIGGSRHDAMTTDALADVLAFLKGSGEWLSRRGIESGLEAAGSAHPRAVIRAAVQQGIRSGDIVTKPGLRRAILHQCASAPECAVSAPAHSVSECASAPAPIGAAHTHTREPFHFDADPFGYGSAHLGSRS